MTRGRRGARDVLLERVLSGLRRAPGLGVGSIGAVLVLAAGFLLGLWGWIEDRPSPPRGDELFYWEQQLASTMNVLTAREPSVDAPALWQIEWARWTVPLFALWLGVVLLGRQLPNRLRVWLTRRLSSYVCVYGSGPLALQLSRAGAERIAVTSTPEGEADVRRARLPFLRGRDRDRLERAADGQNVISADESDLANAELSQELFRSTRSRPKHIFARIDNLPLRSYLSEHYGTSPAESDTRLTLFSPVELRARKCIREHPLDRFRLADRPDSHHALVIGLGQVGEAVMLALLESSHFAHGRPARITVVDRDPESRKAELQARFPQAYCHYPLRFTGADPSNGGVPYDVLNELIDRKLEPTAVFVCLPDSSTSAAVGLSLLKQYRLLGVHLPPIQIITGEAGIDGSALADGGGLLRFLRTEIEIVNDELRLQEDLDGLARGIHESYLQDQLRKGARLGDRPSYREWPQLSESFKEDNRQQADHHWLKLRDVGCAVTSGKGALFEFSGDEVEALAAAEHHRWLASRRIRGWTFGPVRDDPRKIHPDVVPWAELPEQRREVSRETVRGIPQTFAKIDKSVRRCVFVRVLGREMPPPGGLEAYRRGIQTRYPERRLVLASEWSTAAEREAGRFFGDGEFADLVHLLPKPVYESVSELSTAERPGFVDLARKAKWAIAEVGSEHPDPLPIVGEFERSECRTLALGNAPGSLSRVDRIAGDGTVRWGA